MAFSTLAATITMSTRSAAPSRDNRSKAVTADHYQSASGTQGLLPLPAHTTIDGYVIDQLLSSGPDDNSYVAYARNGSGTAYRVVEYPAGEQRTIAALAKLRLEHPALLAPCAALTLGERAYVITPLP